jgi:hypothetical protein
MPEWERLPDLVHLRGEATPSPASSTGGGGGGDGIAGPSSAPATAKP